MGDEGYKARAMDLFHRQASFGEGGGRARAAKSAQLDRQGVQNPLEMGPNTSFQQPAREKKQQVNLPREAFQKGDQGLLIMKSLLDFAQVGGGEYVKAMQRKIDEDTLIQTSRAAKRLIPTDDATVAGYQAHAAVKAGQLSHQYAAELIALSKAGASDKEYEERLRQGSQNVDEEMRKSYENYDTDPVIQKHTASILREQSLKAGESRVLDKIDTEITNRENTFSDALLQIIKAPGKDTDQRVQDIDALGKTLKLSPPQIEKAVLEALSNDGSLESIELSKSYKGIGRKSTLFDRSASLQKLERNLSAKQGEVDQYQYLKHRREMEQKFLAGDLTEEQFTIYARTDPTLTPAKTMALFEKKDKLVADQVRLAQVAKSVSDPMNRVDPTTTKAEIQSALSQDLETNIRLASEEAGIDKMQDGPEKVAALKTIKSTAIRRSANNALDEGVVLDNFVKDFNQLAQTDIALLQTQYQDQEGKKVALTYEKTPATFQAAYDTFESMSPAAQQAHLNAMEPQSADTLRSAVDLIKSGIPKVEAFRKAQIDSRVPKAVKTKEVKAAVDEVIDDLGSWFPWAGLDSVQEAYVNEQVRGELSRSQDPASKSNVERVSKSFQKQHTVSDDIFYYGTAKELTDATHLNTDKLTDAFNLVRLSPGVAERLKAASETYGFEVQDCYAVTNPKTGSFHYRSPDGSYISDEYRLDSLQDLWNEQKVRAERRSEEVASKSAYSLEAHEALMNNLRTGSPIDPKYIKKNKGADARETFSWLWKNVSEGMSEWWVTHDERDKMNKDRSVMEEAAKVEMQDKYLNKNKRQVGVSLK